MIENYFQEIIQALSSSFAVIFFEVKRLNIGEDEGFIRVKCNLRNDDVFEFAEYITMNKVKSKFNHIAIIGNAPMVL